MKEEKKPEISRYIPTEKVMIKMPRFDNIVLGVTNGKRYRIMPISDANTKEISDGYKLKAEHEKNGKSHVFYVEINNYRIYNDDIILFGDSLDNSERILKGVEEIVFSNKMLTAPSEVDLKTLTMSNKISTGVSIGKYFTYVIGLLGNPKNVIIFKEW